jgi:hypothetical protein
MRSGTRWFRAGKYQVDWDQDAGWAISQATAQSKIEDDGAFRVDQIIEMVRRQNDCCCNIAIPSQVDPWDDLEVRLC